MSLDDITTVLIPAEYDSILQNSDFSLEKFNNTSKMLYFNKSRIVPIFEPDLHFMQKKVDLCDEMLLGKQNLKDNLENIKNETILKLVASEYTVGAQVDIKDQNYYIFINTPYNQWDGHYTYCIENILRNEEVRTKLLSSNLDLQKTKAYAIDDLGIGYIQAVLFSDDITEYVLFLSPYPFTDKGQFYYQKYMTKDELHFLMQPRFEANELYEVKTCVKYIKEMEIILNNSAQRAHDAGEL